MIEDRLSIVRASDDRVNSSFSASVKDGLSAFPTKTLCCFYLYDSAGSKLFEDICSLPEYYLTRAEQEILDSQSDSIVSCFDDNTVIIELGSGSSSKTRSLLQSFIHRRQQQASGKLLHYVPIDISPSMLEQSSRQLLQDMPQLRITAIAREYKEGLWTAKSNVAELRGGAPKLILWLGSSIGNLDHEEAPNFLSDLSRTMGPSDGLLIGMDLKKEPEILERAYNDAAGVTAQFNLNLLHRINKELGGDFQIDQWSHKALYNETLGRIEMHLVSRREQSVFIRELRTRVSFHEGETIHTENSYKYDNDQIRKLSEAAGLDLEHQWNDSSRLFSLNLFRKR